MDKEDVVHTYNGILLSLSSIFHHRPACFLLCSSQMVPLFSGWNPGPSPWIVQPEAIQQMPWVGACSAGESDSVLHLHLFVAADVYQLYKVALITTLCFGKISVI